MNIRQSTQQSTTRVGALMAPPCLIESSHGWVPVNTHSTPVLPKERRLWVAHQQHNRNTSDTTCNEAEEHEVRTPVAEHGYATTEDHDHVTNHDTSVQSGIKWVQQSQPPRVSKRTRRAGRDLVYTGLERRCDEYTKRCGEGSLDEIAEARCAAYGTWMRCSGKARSMTMTLVKQ